MATLEDILRAIFAVKSPSQQSNPLQGVPPQALLNIPGANPVAASPGLEPLGQQPFGVASPIGGPPLSASPSLPERFATNIGKSLIGRGAESGGRTAFDFPGEQPVATLPGTLPAAAPDDSAARAFLEERAKQRGGASVATPSPITAAPIPKVEPISGAGKIADINLESSSGDFGEASKDLDTKVANIIDAFGETAPSGEIDAQGIRQQGVLSGAARAAFAALQDPNSGFNQLGIGGIILAAGLGSVQGLAKAEREIRAEGKEAAKAKAQFGQFKASLMTDLQKVVIGLKQASLTDETRRDIANMQKQIAAIKEETASKRFAADQNLQNVRIQLSQLNVQLNQILAQSLIGSREAAAKTAQRKLTGIPEPIPTGDAVKDAAAEIAFDAAANNNVPALLQPFANKAADLTNEIITKLSPGITGTQREKLRREVFNNQLKLLLSSAPNLVAEIMRSR